MLSNFSSLRYSLKWRLQRELVTKGGLLVFVIIPAIALIMAGYSANRRFPMEQQLKDSMLLFDAAIYAILTGVASFAGVSVK